MNLLRFSSIIRLAEGKTVLETLAMNHDKDRLFPIVHRVTDFPFHTNIMTEEFIETTAGLFNTYLSEYSQRRKEDNREENIAIVVSIILACLIKMTRRNDTIMVPHELPVANDLFNKCMEIEATVVLKQVDKAPAELQTGMDQNLKDLP